MLKRQVILETLEMLFEHWEMAEPLYNLVNSMDVTAGVIDEVLHMIDISYRKLDDIDQKEKMELAMDNLKSIKSKEMNERIHENEEVNDAVSNLAY
ncbi:MAG: hypothetical protein ACD_2C00037G0002 [uncultured bacterium (gcode 4)]|uniref:Uncharacterized protein n=1 Tax=uncultured bacterium (gcode 4) TaxID=1234023 RepID=K2G4J5_9BACT|nr:MAG: hypothetical protein ACD_2C00037G0002 [uncultured bacterium (gcode 4)]